MNYPVENLEDYEVELGRLESPKYAPYLRHYRIGRVTAKQPQNKIVPFHEGKRFVIKMYRVT